VVYLGVVVDNGQSDDVYIVIMKSWLYDKTRKGGDILIVIYNYWRLNKSTSSIFLERVCGSVVPFFAHFPQDQVNNVEIA